MTDRHAKWTPVEPGTVIPAGQPYRLEYANGDAIEERHPTDREAGRGILLEPVATFVDSSWRPPLVLPTEPTWGIAVVSELDESCSIETVHQITDRWSLGLANKYASEPTLNGEGTAHIAEVPEDVLDFIPLTDEQVARIEVAR